MRCIKAGALQSRSILVADFPQRNGLQIENITKYGQKCILEESHRKF